jgi:hypothetical protein
MRRGSAEMRAEMNRIFWAADSTVQTNDYTTYPQTGIGQVFPLFVKPEYQVCNHAKNGRSTKSFMDEGRLKAFGAILPFMALYPFLQKYFVKGVNIGAVKE